MSAALRWMLLLAAAPLVAQSAPYTASPDTLAFPEGIDADPRTGTLYVTSLRHRTVLCGPLGQALTTCVRPDDAERPAAMLGVAVDTARNALWLTTAGLPHMEGYTAGDTARAELLRVRLADGRIERRWRLGTGTGVPGELALTPTGDVLVSDGVLGVLYRLRAGTDTLAVVRSPLLRSPQGIAVSADGRTAWVADWSRELRRWDLTTDAIEQVTPLPGGTLRGLDGLRRAGRQLIGIQNGADPQRVVALTLSADGRAVTEFRTLDAPPLDGEPTVGTVLGTRYVYVASSQWPFFSEAGGRIGTRALPPVVLRVLELSPP